MRNGILIQTFRHSGVKENRTQIRLNHVSNLIKEKQYFEQPNVFCNKHPEIHSIRCYKTTNVFVYITHSFILNSKKITNFSFKFEKA